MPHDGAERCAQRVSWLDQRPGASEKHPDRHIHKETQVPNLRENRRSLVGRLKISKQTNDLSRMTDYLSKDNDLFKDETVPRTNRGSTKRWSGLTTSRNFYSGESDPQAIKPTGFFFFRTHVVRQTTKNGSTQTGPT